MLVMVVALLVFGPEKLPEMARNLGRTASQLRRMAQDMKDDFSTALDDDEEDRPAPGSGSTRPRAAGALPGDNDSSADSVGEADEPTSGHDSAEDATAGDSGAHKEDDDRPTLHDATADDSSATHEYDERSTQPDISAGSSSAAEEADESTSLQASARDGSDATEEADESTSIENSARGSDAEIQENESDSIRDDLERLNRQQQDAEAAATTPRMGESKVERSE